MAEDFMAAAVKRVEEQFAKSGVSESCAAFERKDSQIEMRDGVIERIVELRSGAKQTEADDVGR